MKKKMEFSKIAVAVVIIIALASIVAWYAAIFYAIKNDYAYTIDTAVPVTAITTILGAYLSYVFYQFGLKNSRNKYGINSEGDPYRKEINENE